jgi:hypothetical protein
MGKKFGRRASLKRKDGGAGGRFHPRLGGHALEADVGVADMRTVVVRYKGQNAPSLTNGEEYVVLAIDVSPDGLKPVTFMVHLPQAQITDWAWYEAALFEVVDGTLAPNWVFSRHEQGPSLMPAAWTPRGHWDDLFADDRGRIERAWSDHRAERDLILSHAGRPPGRPGSIGGICRWPGVPAPD